MFINDFHMPAAAEPLPMTRTRRNSRVVLQGANNLTKVLRRVEQRPSSANAQEVPVQPLRNVDDGSVEVDEGTLAVLGFQTRGQEVDAVTRFVKQSVEQYGDACKPGDSPVAVLFRGKKSMALYEDQLSQVTLRDGRPLRVRAVGLSAMLDRPEVQDVLALLKVVGDHTDANALMRLLATPRYALGALDLKRLARRAADLNTEYRFRTLVEAGLAPAGTPKREWGALVRQYARNAPNMVYLIDMLLRDDVEAQLEAAGLSDEGRAGVMQAVRAMHRVQDEMYQPLAPGDPHRGGGVEPRRRPHGGKQSTNGGSAGSARCSACGNRCAARDGEHLHVGDRATAASYITWVPDLPRHGEWQRYAGGSR